MKVVITAATAIEIDRIKQNIKPDYLNGKSRLEIIFNISGVGILNSCFSISQLIFTEKPHLIIQAGIAGCFDTVEPLGKVFVVKQEFIGDSGVEENGVFLDVFDMKFQDRNEFPFTDKSLPNPYLEKFNLLKLEEAIGLTVNEITTRKERIAQLKEKYNPLVESMEGAALHLSCLKTSVQFIQFRAISNYVGERDKSKWQFGEAFRNLSDTVLSYLDELEKRQ